MNIGKVTVPPAVKFVITKSSIDRLKARSAAANTPGRMSGKVTLRKVVSSFAPRSIAASSRCTGKPASRARTVTTTKLMLNMMWAMRIVIALSGKNGGAAIATKSVSNDAPRTISGVAIGRKMNRLVVLRPRKSCRARARAMSVPRIVATIVENNAMIRLIVTALWRPGTEKMLSQASIENPCHTKLLLPAGSLKLNSAMTKTGAIR